MAEFWTSSGYHLLERGRSGHLGLTDDYLRAFLMRAELHPIEESCEMERAVHDDLMSDPCRAIEESRLETIADADAAENYRFLLAFRDVLVAAGSLEAGYLDIVRADGIALPPIFLDRLAHAILRNILDGSEDPVRVRAAELLFREQRVTLQDSAVMVADAETVDAHASGRNLGSLGQLAAQAGTELASVELDVMTLANAGQYWERSDLFDMVLDLRFTAPGLDALARCLEAWIAHFLDIKTRIQPAPSITDERWSWHIGLDAEASKLLDALYQGDDVGEDRMRRLISLFVLEFDNPAQMAPAIAGRPVYLGMAMSQSGVLRLKPQNILVNLPLASAG
ncbi:MAG: DUF6352 family protein [Alphaproteobacteria bacterium]|nr:DUF6352 family protein [Alphaproteobacteria bacterium]